MFHIVTGGSGSGKSAYGESLVLAEREGRRIYLATMRPWDEEMVHKIEKHRRMRAEKRFETVEMYDRICRRDDMPEEWQGHFPEDGVVLLECLSNLTANLFYNPDYARRDLADMIAEDVLWLKRQVRTLIVVTNEVFSDGILYDKETRDYQAILAGVNRRLAAEADTVTEVVYGIPVPVKGKERPWI